jgi:gamma-glutamyltranspeptidase/glutathione hydrolase
LPSSGGIGVLQMLRMLAPYDIASMGPASFWSVHFISEAGRLAFADRSVYAADPAFYTPPAGLLNDDYLRARSALIRADTSMGRAQPGDPSEFAEPTRKVAWGADAALDLPSTSHISIVDKFGNALAMTTSIENQFGSRQMVNVSGAAGGFLLNNELTDFSFSPTDSAGKAVANRVQPGKRPRSSMSPTLVFDRASGALVMSTGSPGGAMIIHFTAKVLYGVLDWGMNAQQAIDLPNFGSLGGPTLLEAKRFPPSVVQALRARGAVVREQPLTSGLQAIQTMPGGWFGGADPRREGVVAGE